MLRRRSFLPALLGGLAIPVQSESMPPQSRPMRSADLAAAGGALTVDTVPVTRPEAFFLAAHADDTISLQAAFAQAGRNVSLTPGKTYAVSDTILLPSGVTVLDCNNAVIQAKFGTDYGRPVFRISPVLNRSVTLRVSQLNVRGNCTVFDMRFSLNAPDAGIQLVVDGFRFDTMEGRRRPGTSFIVMDQFDFCSLRDGAVTNCDLAFEFGSAPPRRNCTQLLIQQVALTQVNSAGKLQGIDKAVIDGVDTARCNSGWDFAGDNQRIEFRNGHVEQIAQGASAQGGYAYSAPSARVLPASAGYGFYVRDNQRNDIRFINCSTIDAGGVADSTAKGGVYVGDCVLPRVQKVTFQGCEFAKAMGGSGDYKAIVNRGRFKWEGVWEYTTEVSLSANGFHYFDMVIDPRESAKAPSENQLPGNTALSLMDRYDGVGDAPLIEDVQLSVAGTSYLMHKIVFKGGPGDLLAATINLPAGWHTLDVTGRHSAGRPLLKVQRNGAPFSTPVLVQFNGASDEEKRWRISFYNPDPNVSYRVGVGAQNGAGDALYLSDIALYRGFGLPLAPRKSVEVVSRLPTITDSRWRGRMLAHRRPGQADKIYFVGNDATDAAGLVALN